MDYVAHYASPLGAMTMTSDGIHLTSLTFDGQWHAICEATSPISNRHSSIPENPVLQQTRAWLDIYFSGSSPDFTPPLLPMHATPFRSAVWKQLLIVPFGQTMSYGDIARCIGCPSAQAVGGAIGHNPIAIIIPCHRVIGSNGALTGYAAGVERKAWLLKHEELKIKIT
ncbi:MAG: methylated-DNA--[protein]-cysteine S-methyltransferase [Bacteroidaceae bacterium]|nr:methylated-DNA--[protein]-cysteine S-methyltransferase [Bacteroidaceae bacterium]